MKFQKYYGIPKDAEYGEKFMSRFPILFQNRNKSMQETCMCWGIECPVGWWHILDQLCTYLEFHNMQFSRDYGIAVVADQVKEKFGTLRFYFSICPVDMDTGMVVNEQENLGEAAKNRIEIARNYLDILADEAIAEAESMTEDTCADCGIPLTDENRIETEGWITFICDECSAKRDAEREEFLEKAREQHPVKENVQENVNTITTQNEVK